MKRKKQSKSPTYFNISPDKAMAEIDRKQKTEDFSRIANIFQRSKEDSSSLSLGDKQEKVLRKFSTWEITHYLIPIATAHFHRVIKANPHLPQGEADTIGGAKWFTLDDVLTLRTFFASEGSKTKEYQPWRPENVPAKIVTVANSKTGVGKTSTATHLAMSAALDGYKVLVIDLDSQGSLTSVFGGTIKDEWQTVYPLLARHFGRCLQEENRRRVQHNEAPQAIDDMLAAAMQIKAQDLIKNTHWPNIDLIGAQMNLLRSELHIPVWRNSVRSWKFWDALVGSLEDDGVLEIYDLVFIDTPSTFGNLTINSLAACDMLFVPTGATYQEFDATTRFFELLYMTFHLIEDGENMAARALGQAGLEFEWDTVRVLITRYNPEHQADFAAHMQACLGPVLAPERQHYTTLIDTAEQPIGGVYETDYRDFNRATYIQGRESFDATYAAFKKLLLGFWRRDQLSQTA